MFFCPQVLLGVAKSSSWKGKSCQFEQADRKEGMKEKKELVS